MQQILLYGFISFVLIILQTTVIPFTSIAAIIPDLLLIWIVFLSVQFGQITGTVSGFIIGLMMDLAGGQFLGLGALSKTVGGFIGGYFFNENKIEHTLGSYQFLIITAVVSFVHNAIYFSVMVQGTDISIQAAIFRFGVLSMLYTVAISLLPMFVYSRRLN